MKLAGKCGVSDGRLSSVEEGLTGVHSKIDLFKVIVLMRRCRSTDAGLQADGFQKCRVKDCPSRQLARLARSCMRLTQQLTKRMTSV